MWFVIIPFLAGAVDILFMIYSNHKVAAGISLGFCWGIAFSILLQVMGAN